MKWNGYQGYEIGEKKSTRAFSLLRSAENNSENSSRLPPPRITGCVMILCYPLRLTQRSF